MNTSAVRSVTFWGRDVEKGEMPVGEMPRIRQMVEDICYYNAKNYFRF